MFSRFNEQARKAMDLARKEVQRWYHDRIGTEHILLGLIQDETCVAVNVLRNLGIDIAKIRDEVAKQICMGYGPAVLAGQLPFSPEAKESLQGAMKEASSLNHGYIGTEHLLLGLLRVQEGVAAKVLSSLGLEMETVRKEVLALLGKEATETPAPSTMRVDLAGWLQGGRARSFEVAGPDGKLWARLGLVGENQPELSVYDAAGVQRIVLGLDASGEPRLEMRDREGKVTFRAP